MPQFSVIISAYQAATTLEASVKSILTQTLRDLEVVIIDDASEDGTALVAGKLAAADPRVRLLTLPRNAGPASARNHGWVNSAAPYVAILDADDIAVPDRLERQLAFLHANPLVTVLGGAAHFVTSDGMRRETVAKPLSHESLHKRRWYDCPFIHSTVVMRRAFLEQHNGYDPTLRLAEDYDLWLRGFGSPAVRYANLSVPLVFYRTRGITNWRMLRAGARARQQAGKREGRPLKGFLAATRILAEGAIEHTRIFQLRDRCRAILGRTSSGPAPTP